MNEHRSGGGLLLTSLKHAGIENFFINSGTEYASLLLEYASMREHIRPQMVVCLSENTAVSAAHGYYFSTGKPAAVLVHTIPGVLNALPNVLNAYSANVPIIFISGVTSFSTKGYTGSRKIRVHWGQEIRDIQSVVGQFVKWDYVVKTMEQIPEAVVRAVEIASSKPEGPVYIGIHREWLLQKTSTAPEIRRPSTISPPSPHPQVVKAIAEKMAEAEFPVVLTRSAGRDRRAFRLLTELAEKLCLRVNHAVGDYVNISTLNVFSAKFDISAADLILVLDTDVPWLPLEEWPTRAYRISVGPDPLKTSLNIWGYDFEQTVQSDTTTFLEMLLEAVDSMMLNREVLEERKQLAKEDWDLHRKNNTRLIQSDMHGKRLTKRLASFLLGKALPQGSIVVNEYSLRTDFVDFDRPGTYFGEPPAGSLGWGFGTALGIKMASLESFVCVVLGDGAFVFNNPVSAVALSRWYRLPVLVVVFNDGCWGDVKKSIADVGAVPSEIVYLEGADFPMPLDIYTTGKGLGLPSFLAENPAEVHDVLAEAITKVMRGEPALVDLRVRVDF